MLLRRASMSWLKSCYLVVILSLLVSTFTLNIPTAHATAPAARAAVPAASPLADTTGMICESFNTYTPGSTIGSYTGWYDGGAGPVVTAGNGVASTVGLAAATNIYNWTAHSFNWNDPTFLSVTFQQDFRTDGSGNFDDDRLSWTINGTSTSSNNQFGVQLDHPNGGIVTYWSNLIGGTKINDVIVPLTAGGTGGTQASTWYRFQAEITKLTATSASIDVTLTELDAGGNPTGTPFIGSIADTSALAAGHTPAADYFTPTMMYPSYKNYTTAAAPADNPCYEMVTSTPPVQHTLDVTMVGSGGVTLNPTGGTYDEGTVVTLTPVPVPGWEFDNWSGTNAGDLIDNGNGTWSITMNAAKEVTVTFTELPLVCYALTLGHTGNGTTPTATPPNSTGCSASQYIAGEAISLSGAAPDSGWQIANWYGTGNNSSTGNTNSLTMPAGTLSAGVNYSEIPAGNNALQFDGTNDHVTFGAAPTLGLTTFTIETWLRRDGTGVRTQTGSGGIVAEPLVTKGRSENDNGNIDMNYFLGINSLGTLGADFEECASATTGCPAGGTAGLNHPVTGTTVIQNGVWYHAAATYDGQVWRLYLNGQLDAQLTLSGVRYPRWDSIQHAGIGTALNSTGVISGAFSGAIDEVRIWNVARTQTEIISTINSELTSGTGLIARWGMNEGAGTTIADSTAPAVDGTLTNGPVWVAGAPFNITPPVQYTLTANTSGNGSVTLNPAGGTYYAGTVVQLTAVPGSGYAFSAWSGDLGGTTNPTTITMNGNKTVTATFVAGGTVTFQEGVSSYVGTLDTTIKAAYPSTTYGSQAYFEWDTVETSGTTPEIALLQFGSIFGSGAGQIPLGSIITSATLQYRVYLNSGSLGNTASVYESLVSWDEATTSNLFGGDAGVQTDEYNPTLVATATAAAINTNYTIDVTASLQRWSSGTSNYGWIFLANGSDGVEVHSSETVTSSYRPLLTVTYQAAPSTPPAAPSGMEATTPQANMVRLAWTDNATNESQLRAGTLDHWHRRNI